MEGTHYPPLPPSFASTNSRPKRRWFLIGSLLFILVGCVVLVSQAFGSTPTDNTSIDEVALHGQGPDKIAVIKLRGVLGEDNSSSGTATSASFVESMSRKANDDPSVKAVLLDIDSPGGGVAASARMYDALKKVNEKKPVVAFYSGDVAASGGLYVSLAARRIIAYPEVLTGSIGVIAHFYDLSGLMDKYGVKENAIKSGKYKDIGSLSRPMSDDERQLLQGLIDEAYGRFVDKVSASRKLPVDQVKLFADGRVLSATQAKRDGLIDEIGSLDDAERSIESLAGIQHAQFVEYQAPFSFGSIFHGLNSQANLNPLDLLEREHATANFTLSYLMQ